MAKKGDAPASDVEMTLTMGVKGWREVLHHETHDLRARLAEQDLRISEAIMLLAPTASEEELIGAIRNLKQVAASEQDNAEKLDARLAEAERRAEDAEGRAGRYLSDRAMALSVKTTDGMTASEWVVRTGQAEHRLARAVAALRRYGNHTSGCKTWTHEVPSNPCTCGFTSTLAEVGEVKP